MTASTSYAPHDPKFEQFLYAPVGEDRGGSTVSVMSVLARLKLDPWEEAADLAALSRDAAEQRLDQLLARCRDVPALGQDHQAVAQSLASLLPKGRVRPRPTTDAPDKPRTIPWSIVLTILAVLFVLIQLGVTGGSGSGQ
ncbi:hypothetical protein M8756_00490 [Lutimaribacter sp. EGI FJ00015]|uniref:Uncharacterized protein n=1 Tax=Lutimaribacter degradans TaxID=2945989 RepID=A0ACC5ZSY0_9RHOB|nr:hypothetical protein [Lutimaribacter sp. EGI FJ00013]MCM2561280.1 hypothetical protein [Lutimaribacter sp. EGI FJ00013]MCO0611769.1 hypothetical protein [Lutimaribacter sp. EGI FJ00015]MCO0635109.1 hypothetical protein [Lutimaribacter sp. EGI FJ00014]